MLTLPRSVRIYLAAGGVDLRKSIDGLSALVAEGRHDVYSGHLYVFLGRRGEKVKILCFERGGFVLYYKRLEKGRFRLPTIAKDATEIELDAAELTMLLDGIDVKRVKRPAAWSPRRT